MDLSTLEPHAGTKRRRKRVGRGPGSGHGKTSGRGHKGQKARSGYSRKAGFEGGQMPFNRRLPKRGFHHGDRWPYAEVNLDLIDKHFDDGAEVTAAAVFAAGLAAARPGGLKVLGRGELTKKFSFKVNKISAGARQKIEAAGGTVEVIPDPVRPKRPEKRTPRETRENG